MDMDIIVQIISNLGFPIAMCIALFWKMDRDAAQHKAETDALKQSLDNNTLILTKVYERLSGHE